MLIKKINGLCLRNFDSFLLSFCENCFILNYKMAGFLEPWFYRANPSGWFLFLLSNSCSPATEEEQKCSVTPHWTLGSRVHQLCPSTPQACSLLKVDTAAVAHWSSGLSDPDWQSAAGARRRVCPGKRRVKIKLDMQLSWSRDLRKLPGCLASPWLDFSFHLQENSGDDSKWLFSRFLGITE